MHGRKRKSQTEKRETGENQREISAAIPLIKNHKNNHQQSPLAEVTGKTLHELPHCHPV